MNRFFPAIILAAFLMIPFSAGAAETTSPLPVIVSIAPQKYILERIAGKHVTVTVLVKPGADPHSYEPTPAQMRQCAAARLYFTIGVPFEDVWLPRISGAAENLAIVSTIKGITRLSFADDALLLADLQLTSNAPKEAASAPPSGKPAPAQKKVTEPHAEDENHAHADADKHDESAHAVHDHEIDKAAPHTEGHSEEHGGGHAEPVTAGEEDHDHQGLDPHVWLSPMLVRQMLPGIARELAKAMPEHAKEFRANAAAFGDELEALDKELAMRFADIPRSKRVFLTFHPSWRYFAHNYELTELAIEVDGKEPGPKAMKGIIDLARKYAITTIFIEPQFPKATAKAIAANINAAVVEADPLAEDLPGIYRNMADKLMTSFTRQ